VLGCELPPGPAHNKKGVVELADDDEVDEERTAMADRLTNGRKTVGDGGTVDTSSSFS
jgi:hypothetical protein